MEPKIGSGSSGSVFIDGSAGSVLNGSGFQFPVRFHCFLLCSSLGFLKYRSRTQFRGRLYGRLIQLETSFDLVQQLGRNWVGLFRANNLMAKISKPPIRKKQKKGL